MSERTAPTADALVRVCPTCGSENEAQAMRCACGALLMGVDLTRATSSQPAVAGAQREAGAAPSEASAMPPAHSPAQSPGAVAAAMLPVVCGFDDCGQSNPPGSTECLYCNRPLGSQVGAVALPTALAQRYRVQHQLAARGAEAELMVVQAREGGPLLMAKVYRKGILPKPEVRRRADAVDERYRVKVLEEGISDGLAYELMEYCSAGSLRDLMRAGAVPPAALVDVVLQLSQALAALHAQGLVHRDLKPENVLLRSREPLHLVLTDFGIASVLEATQRFTGDARTLAYASPESLSGVVDRKYDYWSLGMVVLEMALGRHPFNGLADPVILHHLVIRNMDLSGVHDQRLRKLLRGLLLRDPAQRWSHDEVLRWLQDDPTLKEVQDTPSSSLFHQPYRLCGELCGTGHELAAALARHWAEGVADIGNGQLLRWFRDVQKDQDAVRLLAAPGGSHGLALEVTLLRLLLLLAPGMPPVWRGLPLDLRGVLSQASRALKGEQDAARWLAALHQADGMSLVARAGDDEAQALAQRWGAAVQDFARAWDARMGFLQQQERARHPDRVVDFDALVFGRGAEVNPPTMEWQHPRLLALVFDAAWPERLRARLKAELLPLLVRCPWLDELGDPATLSPTELLVLEALLPEARRVAEQQQRFERQAEEVRQQELREMQAQYEELTESMRERSCRRFLGSRTVTALRDDIGQFDALVARLRQQATGDEAWQELRRKALRLEPLLARMVALIERLQERRALNTGFFDRRVLGAFLGTLFVLPAIPGNWATFAVVSAALGLIAWRLLPNRWLMNDIRALGERLPP